jgi:hypothetical protein
MGEKMIALVPDNWYIEDKWIINDNKIRLYLDNMYEDEYKYVSLNRYKYDVSVQNIIAEYDPPVKLAKNVKLKIKHLTDFDMFMMKRQKEELYKEKMLAAWEKYKLDNDLQRPLSQIDEKCDEVYMKLQSEREKLEEVVAKKANKYTTPAKRNSALLTNKEYIAQKQKVDQVEVDFNNLVDKIKLEDVNWEYAKQSEFEEKVYKLQQKDAS